MEHEEKSEKPSLQTPACRCAADCCPAFVRGFVCGRGAAGRNADAGSGLEHADQDAEADQDAQAYGNAQADAYPEADRDTQAHADGISV